MRYDMHRGFTKPKSPCNPMKSSCGIYKPYLMHPCKSRYNILTGMHIFVHNVLHAKLHRYSPHLNVDSFLCESFRSNDKIFEMKLFVFIPNSTIRRNQYKLRKLQRLFALYSFVPEFVNFLRKLRIM